MKRLVAGFRYPKVIRQQARFAANLVEGAWLKAPEDEDDQATFARIWAAIGDLDVSLGVGFKRRSP